LPLLFGIMAIVSGLSAALPVAAAPNTRDTDKSAVRSFFMELDEVCYYRAVDVWIVDDLELWL
jgi:hypothetical protein